MQNFDERRYTWVWRGLPSPETGRAVDIGINRDRFQVHIMDKKHGGPEYWRTIFGRELADGLRESFRLTVDELFKKLDQACKKMELHVRAGLRHPLVLLYRRSETRDTLTGQTNTWHVVTPAGAEVVIRGREVRTAFFRKDAIRNKAPEEWCRDVAMTIRAYFQASNAEPGGVFVKDDRGRGKEYYQERVVFVTDYAWANVEKSVPKLEGTPQNEGDQEIRHQGTSM